MAPKERLSQHPTLQETMQHHQPQLYITVCCSHIPNKTTMVRRQESKMAVEGK